MMDAFHATLEACDPALGRFRAYRIEAGTDLLGDWVVEVTYGRIGAPGRTLRQAVPDEAAARKLVGQHLRRRATARRRIGTAYRLCEINDPRLWATAIRLGKAGRVC